MSKINIPKEQLEALYSQMSAASIAKIFNTHPVAIRFLLVKYGIKKPKLRDKSFKAIDDQSIKDMQAQGLSALEISRALDLPYSSVLNTVNAINSKNMRVSKAKLYTMYCQKCMSITQISKRLKISRVSIWRYIKAYSLARHSDIPENQLLADTEALKALNKTLTQAKLELSDRYKIPPEQVSFLLKKYNISFSKTNKAEKAILGTLQCSSLPELYAKSSLHNIAKALGVSTYIARRVLAQNNIQIRKRGELINKKIPKAKPKEVPDALAKPKKRGKPPAPLLILDKDMLEKAFLEEGKDTKSIYLRKELCLRFGVSTRVLNRNLKHHNIRRRSFKDVSVYEEIISDKERLESLYKNCTLYQISDYFGVSTTFITRCLVQHKIKVD